MTAATAVRSLVPEPSSPTLSVVPWVRPRISWLKATPFFLVHALPLLAFATGTNAIDWVACLVLYYARMVGITAGYHRYFAHRAFRTNRVVQFFLAVLGTMASQKGVLWWAGHHRHHHKHSDLEEDIHSPKKGFWWSHVSWILVTTYDDTPLHKIQDFAKFPELRFLNKHWWLPPTLLGVATFLVGGWSMLLIGFFLSTALLYHGTFIVNSLAHMWGSRRFETTDTSRNNLLIALLTCGEGWHNNHHHYQSSANQGFFWYEVDLSYYVIKALEAVGLAWDVRKPPAALLQKP